MTTEIAPESDVPQTRGQTALWRRVSRGVVQVAVYGFGALVAVFASNVSSLFGREEWPGAVYALMFFSTPFFAIAGAKTGRWLLWLLIYIGLSSAIYFLIAWNGN